MPKSILTSKTKISAPILIQASTVNTGLPIKTLNTNGSLGKKARKEAKSELKKKSKKVFAKLLSKLKRLRRRQTVKITPNSKIKTKSESERKSRKVPEGFENVASVLSDEEMEKILKQHKEQDKKLEEKKRTNSIKRGFESKAFRNAIQKWRTEWNLQTKKQKENSERRKATAEKLGGPIESDTTLGNLGLSNENMTPELREFLKKKNMNPINALPLYSEGEHGELMPLQSNNNVYVNSKKVLK